MRTARSFAVPMLVFAAFLSTFAADRAAARSPRRKDQHRIMWRFDVNDGLAQAAKQGKPVMIDFMAVWCPPCKAMEDSTFSDRGVVEKASAFVPVRIDIDKQRDVATKYGALARKYGGIGIPNILFLAPDGTKLKHIVGYYGPRELVAAMDSALTLSK